MLLAWTVLPRFRPEAPPRLHLPVFFAKRRSKAHALPQSCTNFSRAEIDAGRCSVMRYRHFTSLMPRRICNDRSVILHNLGSCFSVSRCIYSAEVAILYSLSQGAFLKGWNEAGSCGRTTANQRQKT